MRIFGGIAYKLKTFQLLFNINSAARCFTAGVGLSKLPSLPVVRSESVTANMVLSPAQSGDFIVRNAKYVTVKPEGIGNLTKEVHTLNM